MSRIDWTLLVILSVFWGGSFFFAELALAELGPFTVVAGRVGIGAAGLWLLLGARSQRLPRNGQAWFALVVMAVLNNAVPFSLITWGQVSIDSGTASILNATTPLFAVVLAHVCTSDEKLTVGKLAGIGCGIAGVAVLFGPSAWRGFGDDLLGPRARSFWPRSAMLAPGSGASAGSPVWTPRRPQPVC